MARSKKVCLIRVRSPEGSRTQLQDRESFTIGRSNEADIISLSLGISRVHLKVHIRDDRIFLEDLGSANGTFIHHQKMEAKSEIVYNPLDELKLGTSDEIFQFELIERPDELGGIEGQQRMARAATMGILEDAKREAKREGEKLLAEAHLEVEKVRKSATEAAREATKKVKEEFDKEISRSLKEAQTQSIVIVGKAHEEAQNIVDKAKADATKLLREAEDKAIQLKKSGEEDSHRMIKDARLAVVNIKMESQSEAEALLKDASQRVLKMTERAEEECDALIKEAQKRAIEIIQENEAESEKTLKEARIASTHMRSEAQSEAEAAKRKAHDKATETLRSAREEADIILKSAKDRVAAVVFKQQEESDRALEAFKAESYHMVEKAKEESAQIIEEAKSEAFERQRSAEAALAKVMGDINSSGEQLQKLMAEKAHMEAETSRIRSSLSEIQSEADLTRRKIENELGVVQKRFIDLQREVTGALAQRDAAKQETEQAIADKLAAEARLQEAEDGRRRAVRDHENATREADKLRNSIQSEIKELKEKALIEYDESRRKTENEVAQMKVRAVEEIKNLRGDEEKQERALRKHKAAEVARQLETILVPRLQGQLKNESKDFVATLNRDLSEMVKRFLLEDTPHANHQIETVLSKDFRAKQRNKQWWIQRIGGGAAAAAALITWISLPDSAKQAVKNTIFGSQHEVSSFSSVSDKMMAEARDKYKYYAVLSDKYHDNYVDNVLQLEGYVEVKVDPSIEEKWIVQISDFFEKHKIDENLIPKFISVESNLIRRLKDMSANLDKRFLEDGFKKMRALEREATDEMRTILKNDKNLESFKKFEKEFVEARRKSPPTSELLLTPQPQDP